MEVYHVEADKYTEKNNADIFQNCAYFRPKGKNAKSLLCECVTDQELVWKMIFFNIKK